MIACALSPCRLCPLSLMQSSPRSNNNNNPEMITHARLQHPRTAPHLRPPHSARGRSLLAPSRDDARAERVRCVLIDPSSNDQLTGTGCGPGAGRSLLGVARGVFRLLAPCTLPPERELPGCAARVLLALPARDAALTCAEFLLPFSLRALGGLRRAAELDEGPRGVGVLGRPLAPGRGVGVFRVGDRPEAPLPAAGEAGASA